jgi:hypothetical protein
MCVYIFVCVPQGGQGAAVIRGPVVSRVINQLVANTSWGGLDYLVIRVLCVCVAWHSHLSLASAQPGRTSGGAERVIFCGGVHLICC